MRCSGNITPQDKVAVEAFQNFLSWGEIPRPQVTFRRMPPAVWAYALGYTQWCPPKGEI